MKTGTKQYLFVQILPHRVMLFYNVMQKKLTQEFGYTQFTQQVKKKWY